MANFAAEACIPDQILFTTFQNIFNELSSNQSFIMTLQIDTSDSSLLLSLNKI